MIWIALANLSSGDVRLSVCVAACKRMRAQLMHLHVYLQRACDCCPGQPLQCLPGLDTQPQRLPRARAPAPNSQWFSVAPNGVAGTIINAPSAALRGAALLSKCCSTHLTADGRLRTDASVASMSSVSRRRPLAAVCVMIAYPTSTYASSVCSSWRACLMSATERCTQQARAPSFYSICSRM